MLLIIGVGIIPVREDEGVVRQVRQRANRARVPLGRIVQLGVVFQRRDLSIRRDDGEEVESSV